jgi:hypothetical protein
MDLPARYLWTSLSNNKAPKYNGIRYKPETRQGQRHRPQASVTHVHTQRDRERERERGDKREEEKE